MSEAPLELWKGVKGKYFRGLTLKELEAQSKINRTEQRITDIILSGHNQPIQNYYDTARAMQRAQTTHPPPIQNECEKDFYKVFEQLSIHKPKV